MNPQVTSPPATAPAKPAGPGRPKDPGKRAAILDAAKRMFVSHGFERVSMDQIVVDVTDIPGVQQDDEVVLIGSQGGERISAEEIGALAGTLNYEVTTALLPRVVRLYRREGVLTTDC